MSPQRTRASLGRLLLLNIHKSAGCYTPRLDIPPEGLNLQQRLDVDVDVEDLVLVAVDSSSSALHPPIVISRVNSNRRLP